VVADQKGKKKIVQNKQTNKQATDHLKQTNKPQLASRVVLGVGEALVGPQVELLGPSGYTPRGFTSNPTAGGEVKIFGFYDKQKNKQKGKRETKKHDT